MTTSFCKLGAVAAILLTVSSCVSTERETATSTKNPRDEFTPPNGRGQRVGGATVLNTVRTTHTFSDPQAPDNFILQMRGPRVLSSRVHLFVVSSKGDTLRHEVLPATALLDDRTLRSNQSATVRDKEISILRGMNSFFSPSHFVQPAVPSTATQPAELDTQAWTSLRDDPKAVGFDYPSGTGESRLAYSRQLNKVLVINQ
ncbi:hypothetical protein J4D99_16730 [Siccationidurans ginsengisoli]|nr:MULTISPECIES: hypothetical protein [unclassified Hymenobacter]MBO2033044.1 hypothetical protein [Hymenobacter sp. BT559]